VKHALVDSEYNTRRAECEEGVSVLKKFDPAISSLRDVHPDFLKKHKYDLREVVFKRCKYVVEEITRVEKACEALQKGDFETVGALMFQTHDGLNLEYQVSVPEMNFMVEMARIHPGVLGSRMMGGGFGGCTINLVEKNAAGQFVAGLREAYRRVFNLEMAAYPVRLTDGLQLLHDGT
jgi:galactokinase